MAGYMGINGVYYKRSHGGTRWKLEVGRESLSLFQVLLKLMLTYGKGRAW
jgi:hypothetical protein